MANPVDKLIAEHDGQIVRFVDLSREAQLAAAHYMAIDGEAWELPEGTDEIDQDDLVDHLPSWLPWYRKEYGETTWGYVEIPKNDLLYAISQSPVGEQYETLEEMALEFEEADELPEHGPKKPWPVILDREHEDILQDGWHRLARYDDLSLRKIPALYYPTDAELRARNPDYPIAGEMVSGLRVLPTVPNTASIAATLYVYEVLPGIRELPLSAFVSAPADLFHAADDLRWTRELAEQLRRSQQIEPLIVVVEPDGPYVLEGAHRMGALHLLEVPTLPALVVLNRESNPHATVKERLLAY
jgi:hypothetical protein